MSKSVFPKRQCAPIARLRAWVLAAGALAGLCALPASAALPPPAAGVNPFPTGNPLVFIEQGVDASGNPLTGGATASKTQLYTAEEIPGAGITFQTQGAPVSTLYNAMGFHQSDMYLYAFQVDTHTLLRIGLGGVVQNLGAVTGLPNADLAANGLNQGTFGDSTCPPTPNCSPDILFVREGSDTLNVKTLWAVDIQNMSATSITLSQNVPNTADMVFSQGYLWTVNGDDTNNGGNPVSIYRINPVNGHVDQFKLPAATTLSTSGIIRQSYGAQWTYGNGNIGIAGNTTHAAYQIQITNPSSATPTFSILSAMYAPTSSQNDGASYHGTAVDMSISKRAASITYDPVTGTDLVTYEFTVKNENPPGQYSSGSTITDTLPSQLTVKSFPSNCSVNSGVLTCNVGPLNGGTTSSVITVTGNVATSSPLFTNTARVTGNEADPDLSNNTSSATTSPLTPVVEITKAASTTAALTPSGSVTYTVRVSNTGMVAAPNTVVSDTLPTGIASTTWTCAASGGAACPNASGSGALNETLVTFPASSVVTYTIVATAASSGLPAVITNTAKASPPTGGICADGSASPCSASVTNPSVPLVNIAKAASTTAALTPSSTVTYTVTATNTGAVSASGTVVSDPLPTGIASTTWTCAAGSGAVCPNASGSGALSETLATFPAGGVVTYTIVATAASSGLPAVVTNTATATPPGGLCADGSAAPCSAAVTNPSVPLVRIAKIASTAAALAPGGSVTYTVTATNTGAVSASGTVVSDTLPTGIASATWTCTASGGAICPNASGSGALNQTLATFPAGGVVTYTIHATAATSGLPAVVTNTATATPPAGGLCADGSASPCSAEVTNPSVPLVRIAKTASTTAALTPGGSVTYTVTATNMGAVSAAGTVVSDPLPTGIASATWTCVASGGAVCPNASGSSPLNQTLATFPASGVVTYTIVATAASSGLPAVVTNTATAAPPAGGMCSDGSALPCSAAVTNPSVPLVRIAKTASTTAALAPGGSVTYTVTATNMGTVSASGTVVSDTLPTGIASTTWTCAASGGAACPRTSGSGALNETLATFPAGGVVTYTIHATAATSGLPAVVTNTATANPPTGGLCADGSAAPCSAAVTNPSVPLVRIAKTASTTAALAPGGSVTYTVTATNMGTVSASGTTVSDTLPTGIASTAWTCTPSGGAVCPRANGSGALNETLATFPVGGVVTYTIVATAASSGLPAVVTNTATASPPSGGMCSDGSALPCSAAVTNPSVPLVRIAKTASTTAALTPGGSVTYTVTATNTGAVSASGTTVNDTLPTGIASATWTCAASGGAVCPNANGSGALNQTLATFPAGGVVTYTIVATAASSGLPAVITNTATANPPTGGLCVGGSCNASVTNPSIPLVRIAKTASTTAALTPGGSVTYTVTATNTGAVSASGTVVSDTLPTGIASATWTCTASGGAVCPRATGSGALNETLATFPAGGVVTYTIVATAVSSGLPATVTNTATATPPTGSLCADGSAAPCSAAVTNPSVPLVRIAKTASTTAALTPGGSVTYTVTATNMGTVSASGTVVSDSLPTGIASATWTCIPSGGAACPRTSGSGALNETLATFPAGGVVTYTIHATAASSGLPAVVTNTATAAPPTGGICSDGSAAPCSAAVTNPSVPLVKIAKTSSTTAALTPGGSVTYTVTATNTGTASASGTRVSDTLPSGIASATWTCAASGGAVCPRVGGSGSLNETLATFPAGGVVTYTIHATAASSGLPAVVTNTATAAPPTGGICSDGSAVPCSAVVTNPSVPLVKIAKTSSTTAALTPGGSVTYTVTATNTGTVSASGTRVSDTLPTGIASATWTCAASGGAACPRASGSGALNETLATFPAGGVVTYTIRATAASSGLPAVVTNTATAALPTGGLCSDGSASPCSAAVDNPAGQGQSGNLGGSVNAIPTLDAGALALLALLLSGLAWFTRRTTTRR